MSIIDAVQKLRSTKSIYRCLPWNGGTLEKYICESLSTIIKIDNKIFLICNYHSINKNNKNICLVNENMEYTLPQKMIIVPEIDTAIFPLDNEIDNYIDIIHYTHIDKLDIDINEISDDDIFNFIIPFNDI